MARSLLKPHATLLAQVQRLVDPLVVFAAGIVAHRLYLGDDLPERYVLALLGVSLASAAVFPLARLYESQRGATLFEDARRLFNATAVLAAGWFAFLFLSKSGVEFSRVWSLWWFGLALAGQLAIRLSIRAALRELRRRGHNLRHVAVVGAGDLGRSIGQRLANAPWTGFVIHRYYDDAPAMVSIDGVEVRSGIDRLYRDLEREAIDQVWIALPLRAEQRIREVLEGLRQHPVEVRFIPDIFNFTLLHHSVTEIAGFPVINLTESPLQGPNRAAKTIEDVVLSALILVVASPLMLAIALAILATSRGPVLFRQQRITWNGERFTMLKFRTMPQDAEAGTGPVWSTHGDDRATPIGRWLRRTSLDELPQFVNVLRGQMSIVGPRPERPEFVERFRREIPGYMQKHLVKAGITGWAQVNDLRGDSSLRERIEYDLYYIENWSVWFDLRIMLLTIAHLVRSRNAH